MLASTVPTGSSGSFWLPRSGLLLVSGRRAPRANPADSRSGIGRDERDGIAIQRRVTLKMQRLRWPAGLDVSLRKATIWIERPGSVDRERTDLTVD